MMMMITHYIIAKHSHAYIQQTDAKRGASKREREREREKIKRIRQIQDMKKKKRRRRLDSKARWRKNME